MKSYQKLYNNNFIKGDNINSPFTLKGMQKLASIFEKKYNYIKIKFINEKDILNEFIYIH